MSHIVAVISVRFKPQKILVPWKLMPRACAGSEGINLVSEGTICDALTQNVLQNFVSKSGSSPYLHARCQHQWGDRMECAH